MHGPETIRNGVYEREHASRAQSALGIRMRASEVAHLQQKIAPQPARSTRARACEMAELKETNTTRASATDTSCDGGHTRARVCSDRKLTKRSSTNGASSSKMSVSDSNDGVWSDSSSSDEFSEDESPAPGPDSFAHAEAAGNGRHEAPQSRMDFPPRLLDGREKSESGSAGSLKRPSLGADERELSATPCRERSTEVSRSDAAALVPEAKVESKGSDVRVIYHICTLGRWKAVVDRQIETLVSSGLYAEAEEILVSICGPEALAWTPPPHLPKMVVRVASADTSGYERPALRLLMETAKKHEAAACFYFHSKGVTHSSAAHYENVTDWSVFMEYALVHNYAMCLHALRKAEFDTCGVNLLYASSWYPEHYSGNFWWANAAYINRIADTPISANYYGPEMWLLSATPRRSWSLKDSGFVHYGRRYPPHLYQHSLCAAPLPNAADTLKATYGSGGFRHASVDCDSSTPFDPSKPHTDQENWVQKDVTNLVVRDYYEEGDVLRILADVAFNKEFGDPCAGSLKHLRLSVGETTLAILPESRTAPFVLFMDQALVDARARSANSSSGSASLKRFETERERS